MKGTWRQALAALSLLLGIVAFSWSVPASGAAESPLPVLQTQTKTVSIFKNGLGFFIRTGETSLQDGWAVMNHVPRSALGTLWLGSLDEGAVVEEMISCKEEVERQREAVSVEEMLRIHTGRRVKILLGEKVIEGIIKSVPEVRPSKQEDGPPDRASSYPPLHPQPISSGEIVIIGTTDGDVVLNKGLVTQVVFPDASSAKVSSREAVKRMKLRVSAKGERARLSLAYLQKGISWVPSYLVNIEDPKRARITMKATVINDAEDLEDVEVVFVVGYPNFLYADILSPMALEESIRGFMSSLEGGTRAREESRLANVMRQSVSFERDEELPRLDHGYAALSGLPGAAEEDLFLYRKQGVDLRKGARADYLVFSDEVAYKHIYEWGVPDTLKVDARGYSRSEQDSKEKEKIWHSVKLTNSTPYPWTTAPALTISGTKPLAQDMIDYTPKQSQRNLKLTVATDIKSDRHEYETERQRDVRLYGHSYDLVTVSGELYVKNYKGEGVNLEIQKRLTGEVIETSHKGKIEKRAEGLGGANQNSTISWEVPIGPQKELKITYKYKVYVAR